MRWQRKKRKISVGNPKVRPWTSQDNLRLRELVKGHSDAEIASLIGERTPDSVRKQRAVLGLKPGKPKVIFWTEPEVAQLRELAKNHRDEEIAKIMDKKLTAVKSKRVSLKIKTFRLPKKKLAHMKKARWSKQAVSDLRILARENSFSEIAIVMGRTRYIIEAKCKELEIRDRAGKGKRSYAYNSMVSRPHGQGPE